MKIAIIGAGISGLTAARLLHAEHDITVFEAGNYVGGHVNTVDVMEEKQKLSIDTGFIVFNDWTYPLFERMLNELGVARQNSEMSFSVHCESTGYEWCGNGLSGLVFNRTNWNQLKSYQLLYEIIRFNRCAKNFLASEDDSITLAEFLDDNNFGKIFCKYYILPMGAAIWSAEPAKINDFPAHSFLLFFQNHGLLNINNRPQWKTVTGGSREYIKKLIEPFQEKIYLNSPVHKIIRTLDKVDVYTEERAEEFDHVFLACHSDQALSMLEQPTGREVDVLQSIRYQANVAYLHCDSDFMPVQKHLWSSWNYTVPKHSEKNVVVTYYMNRLQSLNAKNSYFVTLNPHQHLDPSKIIKRIEYAHPVFDSAAVKSQQLLSGLNGTHRTWFCGAYWRNGFHEDGVWSATKTVEQFNKDSRYGELLLRRAS